MPYRDLIIALHNSDLALDRRIFHLLWEEQGHTSEKVLHFLLSALETSAEDHPEILNLLLAECAPYYTIEITEF
jgi:hypothetical protein